MQDGCILAIDPGTAKLGWALVDPAGAVLGQGVLYTSNWEQELGRTLSDKTIELIVLGDGTNRLNMQQGLMRLYPQAKLAKVDERASTVEAWELKRSEATGGNPLKLLWFTLVQLFHSAPVDDYAARVLARRFLAQQAGRESRV